jgi:primosomal protein DnaI
MESLSDILKHMPIKSNAASVADKRKWVMAHPAVGQLLERYPQLDEAAINSSMSRLYQYAIEYDHCSNCPGLANCPNDFPGHYTRLSVSEAGGNVQICDHKVTCNKLIAQQTEDAVRKRIKSFYVDEQVLKQRNSFSEISELDRERKAAVKKIGAYILKTAKDGLQAKGLYLVGGFGTGKTYLVCYMLQELAKQGYTGVIVYMPDFMEDLKAMFQEPQKLKDTIEMMKQTDLLVFDDIGAENMNPWLRDHVLGSILNYRMNRKPTLYTSNHDLDWLEHHLSFTNKDGEEEEKGRRIMERIRPFVDVVAVTGSNKRGL